MSASKAEQLRNFIDNNIDNDPLDSGQFDAGLRSRDLPHYAFTELKLSPEHILEVFEHSLSERQLTLEVSSYYIAHEERFKIFLILCHLCYPIPSGRRSNTASTFDVQCKSFRDLLAPKLHHFIFDLVFPCKSAIRSQLDRVRKECDLWFRQNTFESKGYLIQNLLHELGRGTLYILNSEEFEEPPNLDDLLQEQSKQKQRQQIQAQQHHQQQQHNNHSTTSTPPYIQFPATFDSKQYNVRDDRSQNNHQPHHHRQGPPHRGQYSYDQRAPSSSNSLSHSGSSQMTPSSGYNDYRGGSRGRGRGRGRGYGDSNHFEPNSWNNRGPGTGVRGRSRFGDRGTGRGRGRDHGPHHRQYGHERGDWFKNGDQSFDRYSNSMNSSNHRGHRGRAPMEPPFRSPPPIPFGGTSRTRSHSRSRSRGRDRGNVRNANNDGDDDDDGERESSCSSTTYEMVCSESVLCGVNPYPETKEFRDEDKMWRSQCEKDRKKQRAERMQSQLKVHEESVDDEFEKLFDEGMKRWDMVQHSCLDRRIWEWPINLNYNDSHSHYGFGTSNIRNSPYFKRSK